MAGKFFCFLLLALVSQGYGRTEIFLDDRDITHHENPLLGISMAISKHWEDKLVSCNIVFPNGFIYEAFPEDTIPTNGVQFMPASDTFRACAVSFSAPSIGTEMSGTYELLSLVEHSDETETLTRQKFNLNVVESSIEWPSQ